MYHKFQKRRDFLTEILPLGSSPIPLKNFMLGVMFLKERKLQLKTRVTEKEKLRIENKAKKCGLSVSEYLRKRALGYSPKALLRMTGISMLCGESPPRRSYRRTQKRLASFTS